jgi:Family of unknown function (DUF6194)
MSVSKGSTAAVSAETITEYITTTFDGVDVVTAMEATFFSLDPIRHFPSIATIVTTDDHDQASDLSRPGVYRLNIGLGRTTFLRLFPNPKAEHDFTALDRLMPHPVYGAQNWVCVLNPSERTFEEVVMPLLDEAYGLERARAKRRKGG